MAKRRGSPRRRSYGKGRKTRSSNKYTVARGGIRL